MNNYFEGCNTIEEGRARYRDLVKEHHPDAGGDTRTMQDINAAWASFQASGAKADGYKRQKEAHAEGRKSAADFHNLDEVAEVLRVKIEFALNLEGVDVELMGFWVWLTGNTQAHKETIKANTEGQEIKWRWAHEKKAWYYAGVPSFNRERRSLDEIRSMHGSQKFSRSQYREENDGVLNA